MLNELIIFCSATMSLMNFGIKQMLHDILFGWLLHILRSLMVAILSLFILVSINNLFKFLFFSKLVSFLTGHIIYIGLLLSLTNLIFLLLLNSCSFLLCQVILFERCAEQLSVLEILILSLHLATLVLLQLHQLSVTLVLEVFELGLPAHFLHLFLFLDLFCELFLDKHLLVSYFSPSVTLLCLILFQVCLNDLVPFIIAHSNLLSSQSHLTSLGFEIIFKKSVSRGYTLCFI